MSQQQTEPQKDSPPPVMNVTGKGNIFGDFNNIVQNFIGDPRMRWYLLGLAGLIIAAGTALYFLLRPEKMLPMSGTLNIAVASFTVAGETTEHNLGMEIARTVFTNLEINLADLKATYGLEIRGPDDSEKASRNLNMPGKDPIERIAEANNAHLVVYGDVKVEGVKYRITPKFYVSPKLMVDHQEVTGSHTLGQTMPITKQNDVVFRKTLTEQMSERMRVLAMMITGLSYFSTHDYKEALTFFQTAKEAWPEKINKEILYLMIGNAAGSAGQYDKAMENFSLALKEDPQYARAMIGMGSVYYMQSMQLASQSKNLADVDKELLKKSIETYKSAREAENQPEGADIETKVHLALGKCYLLQKEIGALASYEDALQEFVAVTQAYQADLEAQPRIKELAGEAYGHQGTIHKRTGQTEEAIKDYEQAVELLDLYPERCGVYKKYLVALGGSSTFCELAEP